MHICEVCPRSPAASCLPVTIAGALPDTRTAACVSCFTVRGQLGCSQCPAVMIGVNVNISVCVFWCMYVCTYFCWVYTKEFSFTRNRQFFKVREPYVPIESMKVVELASSCCLFSLLPILVGRLIWVSLMVLHCHMFTARLDSLLLKCLLSLLLILLIGGLFVPY